MLTLTTGSARRKSVSGTQELRVLLGPGPAPRLGAWHFRPSGGDEWISPTEGFVCVSSYFTSRQYHCPVACPQC